MICCVFKGWVQLTNILKPHTATLATQLPYVDLQFVKMYIHLSTKGKKKPTAKSTEPREKQGKQSAPRGSLAVPLPGWHKGTKAQRKDSEPTAISFRSIVVQFQGADLSGYQTAFAAQRGFFKSFSIGANSEPQVCES